MSTEMHQWPGILRTAALAFEEQQRELHYFKSYTTGDAQAYQDELSVCRRELGAMRRDRDFALTEIKRLNDRLTQARDQMTALLKSMQRTT